MNTKTIAATVAAVMLTAGAGATTWAVVFDQQPATAAAEPIVTTVYVDEAGNPVDIAAVADTTPAPAIEAPAVEAPTAYAEEAEYAEGAEYEDHDSYEEGEYSEAHSEDDDSYEEEEHA